MRSLIEPAIIIEPPAFHERTTHRIKRLERSTMTNGLVDTSMKVLKNRAI